MRRGARGKTSGALPAEPGPPKASGTDDNCRDTNHQRHGGFILEGPK
jgi:hypothetical protein